MSDENRTPAIDSSPDLVTDDRSQTRSPGRLFKQHAGSKDQVVTGLWAKVALTLRRDQD